MTSARMITAAGLLLLLPALVSAQTAAGVGDTVAAVLERCAQASGGEALRGIRSEIRKGTLTRGTQGAAPFEISAKAPGKWHYNQVFAFGDQISYGSDGRTAWVQDGKGTGDLDPEMRLDLILMLDIQAPLNLRKLFPKMSIKPGGGEEKVVLIEAETLKGRLRELAFDRESGLLLRAGDLHFEDYREIDRIKRPFKILIGDDLGGDHLRLTMQIVESVLDTEVDDARFERPACPAPPRDPPLYTRFRLVEVSEAALDACVGVYRDPDKHEITYTVSRQGPHLMLQRTAWPAKIEIKPASEVDYFVRFLNWKFHFVKDGTGGVTHLEPGQGSTPRFEKIKEETPHG